REEGAVPVPGPASAPARAPLAYTPTHLVEKIRAARPALEGERKQGQVVAVLGESGMRRFCLFWERPEAPLLQLRQCWKGNAPALMAYRNPSRPRCSNLPAHSPMAGLVQAPSPVTILGSWSARPSHGPEITGGRADHGCDEDERWHHGDGNGGWS